ncbi:hypothetical protein [Cohnella lupini]|uniref:Uncharacterized protein n=1 Tax=Cohnella lupini TaxID=1294267 RepID=A0A3D9I5Z0_9BACL|nr:hypothetical protein [Cohnella lupini]RED57184.1 hypothetical protein DFP95_11198 [Cohnella lupini]
MANDHYRKLGAAFLIAAGIIYAIERVGSIIAQSNERAAMYAANINASPEIHVASFFDNVFVPALTFIGVLLLVYGFPRK